MKAVKKGGGEGKRKGMRMKDTPPGSYSLRTSLGFQEF